MLFLSDYSCLAGGNVQTFYGEYNAAISNSRAKKNRAYSPVFCLKNEI